MQGRAGETAARSDEDPDKGSGPTFKMVTNDEHNSRGE